MTASPARDRHTRRPLCPPTTAVARARHRLSSRLAAWEQRPAGGDIDSTPAADASRHARSQRRPGSHGSYHPARRLIPPAGFHPSAPAMSPLLTVMKYRLVDRATAHVPQPLSLPPLLPLHAPHRLFTPSLDCLHIGALVPPTPIEVLRPSTCTLGSSHCFLREPC